jgi:tetratricopeptide (TPR) repeat protein
MKSLKPMLFRHLLLILIFSVVASTIAVGNEQSLEAIQKDYRNVLKEKKPEKQIKKHRDLVNKWKEKGYLEDLIFLYETDAATERANAALHYGLGYAYANQGRIDAAQTAALFEKAANQFERTIALDPTLSQAHFSLGAVYQEQDKLELAAQAMEACLQLNPKYYPAHYRLGEIQLQQDVPEAALESFQSAQKMNKKWAPPYYGIGSAHYRLGNNNAARRALEEAINRDPKFAPAHFTLGQVLAKEGLFNEAWGKYEAGRKYQPYTLEDLYELGTIFLQSGNQAGAIDIFRRIIDSIDPRHTAVLLQLGELYYATGEEAMAIEHYKQAIEADPSLKNHFMEQLAPYHAGLMGRNEAKSILKRFLAVLPDDPRASFHYAQLETRAI